MDRVNPSQEIRAIIDHELRNLDRPELRDLCVPNAPNRPEIPDPTQLQPIIEQHNNSNDRSLPAARNVSQWDGRTREGTFLDLGNGQVAQHQGRGDYAIMDVQRDLHGLQPPIGQYAAISPNGLVQTPQQALYPTLGFGLGS